jgi:hypothetical protein
MHSGRALSRPLAEARGRSAISRGSQRR